MTAQTLTAPAAPQARIAELEAENRELREKLRDQHLVIGRLRADLAAADVASITAMVATAQQHHEGLAASLALLEMLESGARPATTTAGHACGRCGCDLSGCLGTGCGHACCCPNSAPAGLAVATAVQTGAS